MLRKKEKKQKNFIKLRSKGSQKEIIKTYIPFFIWQHSFIRWKKEGYLNYFFESPENVRQYIVDSVYCIGIPYNTDSRDISNRTHRKEFFYIVQK